MRNFLEYFFKKKKVINFFNNFLCMYLGYILINYFKKLYIKNEKVTNFYCNFFNFL